MATISWLSMRRAWYTTPNDPLPITCKVFTKEETLSPWTEEINELIKWSAKTDIFIRVTTAADIANNLSLSVSVQLQQQRVNMEWISNDLCHNFTVYVHFQCLNWYNPFKSRSAATCDIGFGGRIGPFCVFLRAVFIRAQQRQVYAYTSYCTKYHTARISIFILNGYFSQWGSESAVWTISQLARSLSKCGTEQQATTSLWNITVLRTWNIKPL